MAKLNGMFLLLCVSFTAIIHDSIIHVTTIGGHGTLQKYRGTGTRYFAKISTAVPVLLN